MDAAANAVMLHTDEHFENTATPARRLLHDFDSLCDPHGYSKNWDDRNHVDTTAHTDALLVDECSDDHPCLYAKILWVNFPQIDSGQSATRRHVH
jgi:hypothetical protein